MEKQQFMIALGQKIAKLREEKGYSQVQFARLIGISRGQLYRYEVGKREIGGHVLSIIAAVLNVEIQELINHVLYMDIREGTVTLSNTKNSCLIKEGRAIRIKHISGMKNLDFLKRMSLWLYIDNGTGLEYCNRALHSFIGPNHINTHVIQPLGLAYTVDNGIEIKIEDLHEPEKDFEVHIIYDLIY